jgi:hypothetical protein
MDEQYGQRLAASAVVPEPLSAPPAPPPPSGGRQPVVELKIKLDNAQLDEVIRQAIQRHVAFDKSPEMSMLARNVELAGQRQAVLDYVLTLACTNCDHVHEGAPCGTLDAVGGLACRCDWLNSIARDIRNLLGAG